MVLNNRPLSHSGHFESQENKKLCFCTSLALDERLDVQNLLFHNCVIKVYLVPFLSLESSFLTAHSLTKRPLVKGNEDAGYEGGCLKGI